MSMIDPRLALSSAPELGLPQERVQSDARPRLGVIDGGLDRAARWARILGSTMLFTVIIGLVGALAVHATIIKHQRALDDGRQQVAVLEAETESLRHELAQLEAPANIVEAARGLGMIDAPTITYLQIPGGELEERTLVAAENQLRAG